MKYTRARQNQRENSFNIVVHGSTAIIVKNLSHDFTRNNRECALKRRLQAKRGPIMRG